ncbi:MAG: bifunctional tetrahydrofolate synthase/dihydrofolate synthase [Candidatus Methylumidiphilus sp.]
MRFAKLHEWLAWQETLHPKSIDLGLGRVRKVYQSLLQPACIPFTLTVGGTNGKGSSVALLDAILRAEGYRVGTYTSPHLLRYNERIKINGESADDTVICDAFDRIDRVRNDISLSFFEFGTLAALDLFSSSKLDVQILEVGLGGRLDAVNIIDPDAALIASIAIDHRDWFGDDRENIALEKAGILRAGKPAVIGDTNPPNSLIEFAQANGIRLTCQGRDFGYEQSDNTWNWNGQGIRLEQLPLPGIPGAHQLLNAFAVLQLLQLITTQRPVSESAIRNGLDSVKLAGRFQYFEGPVPVLVDVAHNPQAASILADFLRTRFPHKRVHAVFAIMKDKDIAGVIEPIKPLVERWYLAPVPLARAASESELREVFRELSVDQVESGFMSAVAAFESAKQNANQGDLVLVFGTFPLVSEYLAHNP